MVDLSTFTLHVLRHFDITHYLNGQPLQSMLKDRYLLPIVYAILKCTQDTRVLSGFARNIAMAVLHVKQHHVCLQHDTFAGYTDSAT